MKLRISRCFRYVPDFFYVSLYPVFLYSRSTGHRPLPETTTESFPNMTSLEEKEKGAAAWTANNYPLAITHFTKAIEIGGDKDFLKVIGAIVPFSYPIIS